MSRLKRIIKKIDWRIACGALGAELLAVWLMPLAAGNGSGQAGFPFLFLTVYDKNLGVSLFHSMHVSIGGLLADWIALYFLILGCGTLYRTLSQRLAKQKTQKER